MAGNIPIYLDILGSNAGALSNISALQSLDATVKKNDASIKTLEKSYAKAHETSAKAFAAGDKKGAAAAAKEASQIQAEIAKRGKASAAAEANAAAIATKNAATKGAVERAAATERIKNQAIENKANAQNLANSVKQARANASLIKIQQGLQPKAKASEFEELGNKIKAAGGPAGSLVSTLEGLGKGGVAGVAIAIVVALVAMTTAAAFAAVALTKYAFAQADAARTSKLFSESALGSASAAGELETVVDQMSNIAPGLSVKLKEIGRDFADVNIRGRNAQLALEAFGTVATARGESAAHAIKSITEASGNAQKFLIGARDRFGEFLSLKGTGIKAADLYQAYAKASGKSIVESQRLLKQGLVPLKTGLEALAIAADTKLGGVAARQMMSLSNQAEKLKENISKLFTGVNIEPFLAGLKTVTDLFSQDTVTGYVLRQVFTAAFTKIAEVAALVFPYVAQVIKGVVFGVLLFADVAKRAYVAISAAFGGSSMSKAEKLQLAFKIGAMAVGAVVGAVAGLTIAITALGALAVLALAPIWIPFALMAAMIYVGIKAVGAIVDEIESLASELKGIDLAKIGGNIVDGLVKGIKSKIADVKSAITEISEAITGTITTDQEVKSPGRKQMRVGGHIGEGLAIGIERKRGRVEDAGMTLSDGASGGIGGGSRTNLVSGTTGNTYQITQNFYGPTNSDDMKRAWRETYVEVMQIESRGGAL